VLHFGSNFFYYMALLLLLTGEIDATSTLRPDTATIFAYRYNSLWYKSVVIF
jgi:hypothetical protein